MPKNSLGRSPPLCADCSVDSSKKLSVSNGARKANTKRIYEFTVYLRVRPFSIVSLAHEPGRVALLLPLQRYIPMLLRRILIPLPLQHRQRLNQLLPRLPRLDDRVHEPAVRRDIRIREPVAELFDLFAANFFSIRSRIQF